MLQAFLALAILCICQCGNSSPSPSSQEIHFVNGQAMVQADTLAHLPDYSIDSNTLMLTVTENNAVSSVKGDLEFIAHKTTAQLYIVIIDKPSTIQELQHTFNKAINNGSIRPVVSAVSFSEIIKLGEILPTQRIIVLRNNDAISNASGYQLFEIPFPSP